MRNLTGEKWQRSPEKRAWDIFLASLVSPVALPMGALALFSVAMIDHVNPLFVQERTGRDGKPFNIFKVRTMPGCKENIPSFGGNFDPRVSQLGRVLKKWRLDETPQVVNIFKGDMAAINPRPLIGEEDAMARKVLGPAKYGNWVDLRGYARPGIGCPFNLVTLKDGLASVTEVPDIEEHFFSRYEIETEYYPTSSIRNEVQLIGEYATLLSREVMAA